MTCLLALALAATLAAPAAAQPARAAPVATAPAPSATAPAPADKLFAIILSPGPKWKPGRPFAEQGLRAHFFYWKALFDAGRVVSAGPMGVDHGLVLLRAKDQASADAVITADPAVKAGTFVGVARVYAPGMVRMGNLPQDEK